MRRGRGLQAKVGVSFVADHETPELVAPRGEIAQACEAAGADALPVCEIYGPIDGDEADDG